MRTSTYIEDLRKNFIKISAKQENAIMKYFGNNIDARFTEQDVWEQTRKVINNA